MARFVRYADANGPRYGEVRGGEIHPLDGPFAAFQPSNEAPLPLADVTLLAPTLPSKIVAIGGNYIKPPMTTGTPFLWIKPPSCLNDPEGVIEIPPEHPLINHEPELAIVIGKAARMVSSIDAPDYIFGFTCLNDVTAGDLSGDGSKFVSSHYFIDGKIFDGFAPLGPWIETDLDTDDLFLECRVNGEVRQRHSTRHRNYGPAELVSMISHVLTLLPGDVIGTGAPPGVQPFAAGDVVEVEIENIGVLRNYARRKA